MDIEKAKATIKENDCNQGEKNVVMQGLKILSQYADVMPEFGHDIMYACDFESMVKQMPEEEVLKMAKLGWFYHEDSDCWAHY